MKEKSTWFDGIEDVRLNAILKERTSRHRKGPSLLAEAGAAPGFVFMRPPCRGDDCLDWPPKNHPPTDPCGGLHWTWQPDLAVRLITNKECPSQSDLTLLQHVLGGNLSNFNMPDPDVRASCSNGIVDILIWGNKVAANSCSDEARQRAQIPEDIADGGSFGVYVSAGLIRRLAQAAFEAAPKRLYANGFPGADGPIHLTGLSVHFESPNIVKTVITGYDDRPWPDVGFTTTITDALLDLRGCTTDSDTDPSRFDEVLALLFAALTTALAIFVPVLFPIPAFVLWTDADAIFNQPDNPSDGGVGCRLMAGLPDQISLPKTGGLPTETAGSFMAMAHLVDVGGTIPVAKKTKLVIPYNVPRVDATGILVSALATIMDRVPAAQVSGPSAISLEEHAASTFAQFGARVTDFFGRLAFSWTAGPNATISNPTAKSTKITFQRGNAKPGDHFARTVTVKVTDVEGSSATASLVVTIFAAETGESLPPVCKVKPWLEICSPGE